MTDDIQISVEDSPEREDLETFSNMLRALNRLKAGEPGYRKVLILARDNNKRVVGGLNGEMYLGWLYIENLAVDERFADKGLGSQLLQAAEAEAKKRRCFAVYVDVLSFQGLPFYQKQGYQVFGELKDFPVGHSRFFLCKQLGSSAPAKRPLKK
jgi:predicted N-acetyltransferase YhbS